MYKKIFMLFLLACMLFGCALDFSRPYKFRQGIDEITSIKLMQQNLVYTSWEDRFFELKSLEPAQYEEFLQDLSALKGQPFINPPFDSFDVFVFCISYVNGEKEYISCYNNAYFIPDKGIVMDSYWFSDDEGFDLLISKYLGKDISKEREGWQNR